eukprot:110615_1
MTYRLEIQVHAIAVPIANVPSAPQSITFSATDTSEGLYIAKIGNATAVAEFAKETYFMAFNGLAKGPVYTSLPRLSDVVVAEVQSRLGATTRGRGNRLRVYRIRQKVEKDGKNIHPVFTSFQ